MDFGLAKANSQLERSEPGIIKGKFSYLSPEAAQGLPVDGKTDIFAVGIILWELLAGRRLFMGETDLETVRMVQAARVPSVRQYNPKVSKDLEEVMMRALAGDPAKRYQSARDFGKDLNQILFHLGRSVSSFDIAQLVEPIRLERAETKRKKSLDKGSIIGTLIDDALFEFSSLDPGDRKSSTQSVLAQVPGAGGGFEDVQSWADDLGIDPRQSAGGPASYEIGNLAALEDDPLSGKTRSSAPPSSDMDSSEPPPARQYDPDAPTDHAAPAVQSENASGKGGMIAFVVLLLALAGAVGAYFGGVIAH